jgi:hypothetical protein
MTLHEFWHDMTQEQAFKDAIKNTVDRWAMFANENYTTVFVAGVGMWGFDVRILRSENEHGLWEFHAYPVINNYALHDVPPYIIFKAKEESYA